jgi:transposase
VPATAGRDPGAPTRRGPPPHPPSNRDRGQGVLVAGDPHRAPPPRHHQLHPREPRDQQAHRKRRGSRGGRPVSYDAKTYTGRNVVERAFNTLKQWRGLATRYDKYAVVYRGGVVLAAILSWLRS